MSQYLTKTVSDQRQAEDLQHQQNVKKQTKNKSQ